MHFYYRITNKLNGKVYIGETNNPIKRWGFHIVISGDENPKGLISIKIKKYGYENFEFEVISCSWTDEFKKEIEKEFITQYDSCNPEIGYNVSPGGKEKSEKTKLSLSSSLGGENNPFYGKKHSPETIKILSDQAKARTGNKNGMFNKHHTEETKLKISKINKGRKHPPRSEEHRQNLSKYPKELKQRILQDRLNGMGGTALSKKYNIPRRTIYTIINVAKLKDSK